MRGRHGAAIPGADTVTVTASPGGATWTATVTTGQCAITFPSPGDVTLTASYAGSANFAISTSNPDTPLTVLGAAFALAISDAQTYAQYGKVLEHTVTPSNSSLSSATAAWRRDFNEVRPHSAIGSRTPTEFAATLRSKGTLSTNPSPSDMLANRDSTK